MKTPKQTLDIVTCNGMREMTEERVIQAMEEYANQKLSDFFKKHCKEYHETWTDYDIEQTIINYLSK